jgi:hypothetical protein
MIAGKKPPVVCPDGTVIFIANMMYAMPAFIDRWATADAAGH